ncbi:carbohydrate kinase family protein [Arsenicicoccus piscis]|uniref:Kinase n=1 Tax=Arsenicicoccus piscis TaxID=673954 RepID=A0ABQ6HP78_9MICO|nr:carbohydrate kinase family protein [Arsenicicoccus piscis]MCH8628671.1 carbohydrate kinase family protein [Arsenicicoccus piscis]GMA19395.1 kinase [Arsenicicoccus piscis]
MRVAVTGSIASDHLMTFKGRFADSLVAEQLDKISLSFLADDLDIRRGGCGPNIAFAMARLGMKPILVGAAGADFDDYRSWLERHGVDCASVRISETLHTARFVVTTDTALAQIATFYAGAMKEARFIELGPVAARVGHLDLVVIGPNDPEAMIRHTDECRSRGIPFAADPSQQLAFMDGPGIRKLIDGADYLFTNEYESYLAEQKTGWSADDIAERVRVRVITRGKDGVVVAERGQEPVQVEAALTDKVKDPTGVGDAFRGGFITGLSLGLSHARAAQLGALLATHVLETVGTQEYRLGQQSFIRRFASVYGEDAAKDLDGLRIR